jgi:hypothetical protein
MSRPNVSAQRIVPVLMLLTATSAGGCFSSVRLLRETPEGGMIVMPNNSNQWPTYYRNRAEFLMHKKCPEGYVIEHEDVIEDNPAARDGRYPYEDFDYNGGYQRITTYDRKQYRLTFRRVSAAALAPPPQANKELPPSVLPPANEDLPPPRPVPVR